MGQGAETTAPIAAEVAANSYVNDRRDDAMDASKIIRLRYDHLQENLISGIFVCVLLMGFDS